MSTKQNKQYMVYYSFTGAYSIDATSAKEAKQKVKALQEKEMDELLVNLNPVKIESAVLV